MEINVAKANIMKISRQPSPVQNMTDQIQPKNAKYFNYLGSMITDDAKCTREITSRIAMAKSAFNMRKVLYSRQPDLNVKKKLAKCYIWSRALYGAENWTHRKVNQR
jgi:hypothetical protein